MKMDVFRAIAIDRAADHTPRCYVCAKLFWAAVLIVAVGNAAYLMVNLIGGM